MKIYIVKWYDEDADNCFKNRGFVNKKEAVSFRSKLNRAYKKGCHDESLDSKADAFVDPVEVIDMPISKKGLIKAFNYK